MNEHSSRSHAIFSITIECSELLGDEKRTLRQGKLHLVDLAVRFIPFSVDIYLDLTNTPIRTAFDFNATQSAEITAST